MHRLWGYIYRYRARYLRGIVCLVVTATLAMSIPLLLKHAVEGIEKGLPFRQIALYILAIIGVALVQGVVRRSHDSSFSMSAETSSTTCAMICSPICRNSLSVIIRASSPAT